jgi:hypothetical protein
MVKVTRLNPEMKKGLVVVITGHGKEIEPQLGIDY